MEADISEEDLKELKNGNKELMKNIIENRAELSGETYFPYESPNNEWALDGYEDEIAFEF